MTREDGFDRSAHERDITGLVVAVVLFSCSPGARTIGRSFDELQWVLKLGQISLTKAQEP